MRVLFDCRYIKDGARDGISRFSIELVKHLEPLTEVTLLVSREDQLQYLPKLPYILGPSEVGMLEPLTSWRLRKHDFDVLFSPMQTVGTLGKRRPVVVTIHDLIYYRHPDPPRDLPAFVRLLWRIYHKAFWPQRMLLRGADGIVTVSNATAAIMKQHRLDVRPIAVVPNAANALGEPISSSQHGAKRLVYMGSFMPYKNVETLVQAAALLPDYELHLLSRISHDDRERLAAINGDARLVFHDGVSDLEYAEVLSNATAAVTASRDEGFGIPLLEAQALGVPVVASDISIFHEVAGDAALYADPDDPEEFARRIRQLESEGEWIARSEAGKAQAAEFSWGASAAALQRFLAEIVQKGRS